MKRRNFLKWLGISPAGLKIVHDQLQETPEPEPVKEVKQPAAPPRVKSQRVLQPQDGVQTCSYYEVILPVDWKP